MSTWISSIAMHDNDDDGDDGCQECDVVCKPYLRPLVSFSFKCGAFGRVFPFAKQV